jgi:hypothetical protein
MDPLTQTRRSPSAPTAQSPANFGEQAYQEMLDGVFQPKATDLRTFPRGPVASAEDRAAVDDLVSELGLSWTDVRA